MLKARLLKRTYRFYESNAPFYKVENFIRTKSFVNKYLDHKDDHTFKIRKAHFWKLLFFTHELIMEMERLTMRIELIDDSNSLP